MSKPHALLAPLTALALCAAAAPVAAADLDPATLVDRLREGGLVIYMRHARTEADYADQVTAVPADCSTQRMLSEAGWQEARRIGAAIRDLKIPVGEVISSQYCRAWQTADLAFGQYRKDAALNFAPAEDYSDAEVAAMRDGVLPHLTAPVTAGNRVIVGHDDPFEAATGIYPEPQGVAFVVAPAGDGGFEVLGSIPPDAWPAP
jgi:phosphohistidine phosphatase SixA